MTELKGNRTHKDRLFRMIFREKEDLLSLYNAINGSHYENTEDLVFNPLEDVLYLGMKNDVSFLIYDHLNLYEQQSSWNPNMPLRGLFYFAKLYQGYVASRHLDIYSKSRLNLPTPKYVVFYNGNKREPDITQLRLSDSFEHLDSAETPCLECVATVLNINCGYNLELMQNCRKLYEYSYLVSKVQDFLRQGMTLEAAISLAIDDCLENDILSEFLLKHRAEVSDMILTEYDEKLHLENTYNEGKKEGRTEGITEGRTEGEVIKLIQISRKKLAKNITPDVIADMLEEPPELIQQISDAIKAQPDWSDEKLFEELLRKP